MSGNKGLHQEGEQIVSQTINELDLLVAANEVAFVRISAEEAINRYGQWNCDYGEWMKDALKKYEEIKSRTSPSPRDGVQDKGEA